MYKINVFIGSILIFMGLESMSQTYGELEVWFNLTETDKILDVKTSPLESFSELDTYFYSSQILDSSFSGVKNFLIPTILNADADEEEISLEVTYLDGLKIKVIGHYGNGQKYGEVNFNRFGIHGEQTFWFKNGIKKQTTNYQNGQVSNELTWYQNGRLHSVTLINDMYLERKSWDDEGLLLYKSFKGNDKIVTDTLFYKNGQVKSAKIKNGGIQPYSEFYSNGQKKIQGEILNVELFKVGTWRSWYDNGLKMEEFHLHDSIPNYPIGIWYHWDKKGNLIKKRTFENGELINTEQFIPGMSRKE